MKTSTAHRIMSLATATLVATTAILPLAARAEAAPSATSATPSRLGDLASFRRIVDDTATLVEQNDLAGAKARIKTLETSWDGAEPSLKPRSASDWHAIDKAIDRALDALRAAKPEQARCRLALADLQSAFDRVATGK